MLIYNIHLFLQLFIICYWIYTNYNIVRKRRYVQNPIFYGILFSSFSITSVLIIEALFNKKEMLLNNWSLYITNVLLNYTFNLIVDYFKKHKKDLKSIENNINNCNLNTKQNDL